MKKISLSGAQATGSLHIGNYLGSIKHWVEMQNDYNCFFFLADLHAITVERSAQELRSSIFSTIATYLACGIDPKTSTIFPQSLVKEHSELAWIFNCVTPLGWLKRMTQFKDKAGKDQEKACLGLFSYPVLMAADILIYKADIVPVGEDQKQHLELARDIAGIINRKFNKEVFKLPEGLMQASKIRIMSLRDGTKKMSKSDPVDTSRINITDSSDQIMQKIKKAKTDTIADFSYDHKTRPEISNLIDIYSIFSGDSIETVITNYRGVGFAKFKSDLAEIIIDSLAPINLRYNQLINDQDYLKQVLSTGSEKARIVAEKTLSEVKELFGFIC